jgi:uncharacterized small protein (TIGR04563 family)
VVQWLPLDLYSSRPQPKTKDLIDKTTLTRAARVRIGADRQQEWSEMANADKRKQSLYFPEDMLKEIQHEAQRLDRSLSWIVQQGWKLARDKLKAFPASNDDPEGLPDPREESV